MHRHVDEQFGIVLLRVLARSQQARETDPAAVVGHVQPRHLIGAGNGPAQRFGPLVDHDDALYDFVVQIVQCGFRNDAAIRRAWERGVLELEYLRGGQADVLIVHTPVSARLWALRRHVAGFVLNRILADIDHEEWFIRVFAT